jgi:hypothetical protein
MPLQASSAASIALIDEIRQVDYRRMQQATRSSG